MGNEGFRKSVVPFCGFLEEGFQVWGVRKGDWAIVSSLGYIVGLSKF